jgi:outer membrane protein assembly factor BamB
MRSLSLAVVALLISGGAAAPADWTHDGYGPAATSYQPAPARLTTLTKLWDVRTPATPDRCTLQGPPVVADGRVFLHVPTGVAAYAAATGVRQWHRRTGVWGPDPDDRERASAIVTDGGLVFVLSGTCHRIGAAPAYLTALDARTGTRRWRQRLDVSTVHLVAGRGVVVVSSWAARQSTVTAYRPADGKQLWRLTGWHSTSVFASGRLLATSHDGQRSRAVSVTTGRTVWSAGRPWTAGAADPGGRHFLVGGDERLSSVDAATGQMRWTITVAGRFANDGRSLFAATGDGIDTYDAATGRKLRTATVGRLPGQPLRAGRLVAAAVEDGQALIVVDAVTGQLVARHDGLRLRGFHPVIAGGRLFTTDGETLTAYEGT